MVLRMRSRAGFVACAVLAAACLATPCALAATSAPSAPAMVTMEETAEIARDLYEGRQLDGANAYRLHFAQGELPPVNAFWLVSAYDGDGYFIANALQRQAIGDRDKLAVNADGSLDILIQADSPGPGKESNWLPVGEAPFNLLMRLYSPKDIVLEGGWSPPLPLRTT